MDETFPNLMKILRKTERSENRTEGVSKQQVLNVVFHVTKAQRALQLVLRNVPTERTSDMGVSVPRGAP